MNPFDDFNTTVKPIDQLTDYDAVLADLRNLGDGNLLGDEAVRLQPFEKLVLEGLINREHLHFWLRRLARALCLGGL